MILLLLLWVVGLAAAAEVATTVRVISEVEEFVADGGGVSPGQLAQEFRRRLVLNDDGPAHDECGDLLEEWVSCRRAEADDEFARKLEETAEDDDDELLTQNERTCKELFRLEASSAMPCHDGLYDDGDEGCEQELFDTYSCYYTVICERTFECEEFDPEMVYDHDDTLVLESPIQTQVAFYNAYPTADYKVCFTYGPSYLQRHARTMGPIGFAEAQHVAFECEDEPCRIYFGVHSVSPASTACDDETRVRLTWDGTYYTNLYYDLNNFLGWGTSTSGDAVPDTWRVISDADNPENKVFANEAIGFGSCEFNFQYPENTTAARRLVDPAEGAPISSNRAAAVNVPDYLDANGLAVSCDDGSVASITFDPSTFCANASQHFYAVGDSLKSIFPLEIFLIDGAECEASAGREDDDIVLEEEEDDAATKRASSSGADGDGASAGGSSNDNDGARSDWQIAVIVILAVLLCLVVVVGVGYVARKRRGTRAWKMTEEGAGKRGGGNDVDDDGLGAELVLATPGPDTKVYVENEVVETPLHQPDPV